MPSKKNKYIPGWQRRQAEQSYRTIYETNRRFAQQEDLLEDRESRMRREYEAANRREMEEAAVRAKKKRAEVRVARQTKFTENQIADELALQELEKKKYMPDSIFKSIFNTLQEDATQLPDLPKSLFDEITEPTISESATNENGGNIALNAIQAFLGGGLGYAIGKYIYGNIIKPFAQNIIDSSLKERKLAAVEEFYNYTDEAQQGAFDRYQAKNRKEGDKNIVRGDNGAPVLEYKYSNAIVKPKKDPVELIYNGLTSPVGRNSDIERRIGDLVYDPKRNDEKRFGSSLWRKDAWTQYKINLNDAQIQDYRGRITASDEIARRGQDALTYYENLETIKKLEDYMTLAASYQNGQIPEDELIKYGISRNMLGVNVNKVADQIRDLEAENERLFESVQLFNGMVPKGKTDIVLSKLNRVLDNWQSSWFGGLSRDWTTPIFNDVDGLRSKLVGFDKADLGTKRRILEEFNKARSAKVKLWKDGIEQNNKDLEEIKKDHTVSDYFKWWEQRASGNLLDGTTWAYKQPGFMGSSNSAWLKQLPGYGMMIVPYLGQIGWGTRAAMAGTSFGLSHSAAQSENFAEVAENFITRLEGNLKAMGTMRWNAFLKEGEAYFKKNGLPIEDDFSRKLIEAYIDGDFKPRNNLRAINEAYTNSVYGANALFDQDMVATDFDNIVNTAIMFTPFGAESKTVKAIESLGKGGNPIIGASAHAFKATKLGKSLAKQFDDLTTFISNVPSKIYKAAKVKAPNAIKTPKIRKTISAIEDWAVSKNNPQAKMLKKTMLKNAKEFAGRALSSSVSEGIEEGKQYLAGQQFISGEFDNRQVTYGLDGIDIAKWGDDMLNGIKSAYVIAGIPLGLELVNDPELIENIKGGMLGGLFQTGATQIAPSTIATIQQAKLGKYVLNNVMAEKAARTDAYEKAKLYAKHATSPRTAAMILQQFDQLAEINEKNKDTDWYIPEELLKSQKDLFKSVASLVNNRAIKNRADFLNLVPGSDKFNGFIATLSQAQRDHSEASDIINEIARIIVEQSKGVSSNRYALDKNGNIVVNMDIGGTTHQLPFTGALLTKPDGTTESKEDAVARLNEQHRGDVLTAIQIKAIQNLLAELETASSASNMFGSSSASMRFVKRRLENYLKNKVQFTSESSRKWFMSHLDDLISEVENKDELLDTHRKYALASVDRDYANMMYQSLMGEHSRLKTETTTNVGVNSLDYLYDDKDHLTTLDNILNAYEKRVQGDDALYDALENDYTDRLEEIENKRREAARAEYMRSHPEAAAEEEVVNTAQQETAKPQTSTHIPLNPTRSNRKVSFNSFDRALDAAKTILNEKKTSQAKIKEAFKKAGVVVPAKYIKTVQDFAKQLVAGEINENDFSLMFVPQGERDAYRKPSNTNTASTASPAETKPKATEETKPAAAEETKPVVESKSTTEEKNIPLSEEDGSRTSSSEEKAAETVGNGHKPIISDSKYENLKKRLREKIRGTLGMNPILNPEVWDIATQMAMYHIERGAYKFVDYAKIMLKEIGEDIRPYLKSFYEFVRISPKASEFADKMTPQEIVRRIDVNDLDHADENNLLDIDDKVKQLLSFIPKILNEISSAIQKYSLDGTSIGVELSIKATNIMRDARSLNDNRFGNVEDIINSIQGHISSARVLIKSVEEQPSDKVVQDPGVTHKNLHLDRDGAIEAQLEEYEKFRNDLTDSVANALAFLSYYATIVRNGLKLSDDAINHCMLWVKFAKNLLNEDTVFINGNEEVIPRLALNQFDFIPPQFTNKIANYIQILEDSGIVVDDAELADAKDLGDLQDWTTYNTTFSRSLEESVAEDDNSLRLLDVTSEPDFLNKCEVELDAVDQGGFTTRIIATFTYNGHRYTPVDVWDASEGDHSEFGRLVRTFAKNKKPGTKIVPIRLGRTNGIIFEQPGGTRVSLTEAGLVDDVYSVSFTNDQDEFMLTRTAPTADGKVVVQATKPGVNNSGNTVVFTYKTTSKRKPMAGNVVFMKKMNYDECTDETQPVVPINIIAEDLTDGDAQLIVDILSGKYSKDHIIGEDGLNSIFINEDGEELGLTCRQVLNLLIPFGLYGQKGNPILHLDFAKYSPSTINVVGRIKGDVESQKRTFYLSTEDGRNAFKKFLTENVRKNISQYVLMQELGVSASQKDHPLKGLYEFLHSVRGAKLYREMRNPNVKREIRFGNSSIVIDIDDVSDSKRKNGITGLGWYIKRKFLTTSYAGISGALISFDGAEVVAADEKTAIIEKSKEQKQSPEKVQKTTPADDGTEKNPQIAKGDNFDEGSVRRVGRRASLNKVTTSKEKGHKRTKEELRQTLSEILNLDEVDVDISSEYLDDETLEKIVSVTSAEAHIVGKCYSDAIILYEYAQEGVEYHEAFHRISEIFLDDRQRKGLYRRYARIWKQTHEGEPSYEDLMEGVADYFMQFMLNRETFDFDHGFIRAFQSIYKVAKFYKSIGSFGLYKLFSDTANGKFKDFKLDDAAKKRAEEFEKRHPKGAAFEVRGTKFKHILNEASYKDVRRSLVYFIFRSSKIAWDGSNIQDLNLNEEGVKDDILKSEEYQYYAEGDSKGALALREAMEHWEEIVPDLAGDIASFATDYIVSYEKEQENAEAAEGEDVTSASISEHMHASYEFSQFSRTTSRVRFFFSQIADVTYSEVDGEIIPTDRLNGMGLPQFLDSKTIFNDLLNQFYDIEDITELMMRLKIAGIDNPIYKTIYNRLRETYKKAYVNNNVDEEMLLVQIFNVIKSNKQQYILSKANRIKDDSGNKVGYTVSLVNIDQEYGARQYRRDWSNLFAHGKSIFVEMGPNGKLRLKKGIRADAMARFWGRLVNTDPNSIPGMAYAFSDEGMRALKNPNTPINKLFTIKVNVNGRVVQKVIDPTNAQDLKLCKEKFVEILNYFGVQFDVDNLNYMLLQKYGRTDHVAMKAMFEDNGTASLKSFMFYLNGTYYRDNNGQLSLNTDEDGNLNGIDPENIFTGTGSGFIGELSDYKYMYRHSHDQLSVMATNNNKFYVISENNYLSDIVSALNRAIQEPYLQGDAFSELKSFVYNYMADEDGVLDPIGSIILTQIDKWRKLPESERRKCKLELVTFPGMKSDEPGDAGVDYFQISQKDDYVSKLTILQEGGIIFPTMSDKKTWVYIKGITLPGIDWHGDMRNQSLLRARVFSPNKENLVDNHGRINFVKGALYTLTQNRDVLEVLRNYFITEHAAVAEAIADYYGIPEDQRVDNYHKGQKIVDKDGKTHVVIQGGRHTSLLNLYDDDDNPIFTSAVLKNGRYVTERDEYDELDRLFFQPQGDESAEDLINRQYRMIERILKHRLEEELEYLEKLGLVERVGSGRTIFDYQNVGIDVVKVDAVYRQLLSNYQVTPGVRHVRGEDGSLKEEEDLSDKDIKNFKALALATVINDGMVKAIMSKNETERVFSGHPAFFKIIYDENGNLIDRSVDQHKRMGGNVSTGQNAATWAKGVREEYVSSEILETDVVSQQIDFITEKMGQSQLRHTALNILLEKEGITIEDDANSKDIVDSINAMSEDELKKIIKDYDEENKKNGVESDLLGFVENITKQRIEGFKNVEDIANGSAFVTDDMFEMLLKSTGNYNSEIQTAFKILRGEKVNGKVYTIKDSLSIAWAYETIMTKVATAQKYTSYEMRKQGRLLIPTYDKYALFPLFKVMCTGNMQKVYKAMKEQHVDMLKIKSAVKNGSQGAKAMIFSEYREDDDPSNENNFKDGDVASQDWKPDFNDSSAGFKFNTYKQKMKYLRKQFNTDPHEKEYLTMGTQMVKVVMQALLPGTEYRTIDGRVLSAKALRDDIMTAINNISKYGDIKLHKEFFNEDGTINEKKFANVLMDELERRGAGRDVIDAFSVVTDPRTGEQRLKVEMDAQGSSEWIQSIIASLVNKRVVEINTPGDLFIQRSIWGMEGKTHVTGDKDLPQSINGGEKLKMINENGSMDCVLSIDFFDSIIPKVPRRDKDGNIVYKVRDGKFVYKKNEDGTDYVDERGQKVRIPEMQRMPFPQAKQWLIDNGIISGVKTGETEWSNANANIVGYRIPTQAASSIHALRCVDVLPVVRDMVMLPEEFVRITGSDFDIDKIFMSLVNYHLSKTKDGKVVADTNFDKNTSEYEQNRLIFDQLSILTALDKDGVPQHIHILHASIDDDASLVKNVVKDLEKSSTKKPRETYQDYVLRGEVSTKQDFVTGKTGIGPFALNNNSHVLTMLYAVKFRSKKSSIMTRLGLERLDKTTDRDGVSIFSWLSGLINAHVDIAKDSYISRANVNPFTYNMTNLLIRTGLGKRTFHFLTQPILVDLAEEFANSGGVYDVDKSRSLSAIRKERRERFVIKYINDNLGTEFKENEYKKAVDSWKKTMRDRGIDVNQAVDYLFNPGNNLLHDLSQARKADGITTTSNDNKSEEFIIETKSGHHKVSAFDIQMLSLEAFVQFEPYANALSDVVKYGKIDTKKQGKSVTEQRAYEDGVKNTFVNPKGVPKYFTSSLYNMYKGTYIKEKTRIAIHDYLTLMSGHSIQATTQFNWQMASLMDYLHLSPNTISIDTLEKISLSIMSWIKSKYINEYAKRHNIDIKGLVSGENTLYDRLLALKIALLTEDKYKPLLDGKGEVSNYLLRALVIGVNQTISQDPIIEKGGQEETYKNAKFVKLLNFFDDDQLDSEGLSSAWSDLLNDARFPELQNFARDLIVYSFVVNSNTGGIKNINRFVPNSWKLLPDGDINQESYNDYIRKTLKDYNNGTAAPLDFEDIILNNWDDYSFIPTERISYGKIQRFRTYFPKGADFPVILAGVSINAEGKVLTPYEENEESDYYRPAPPYIKVKRANDDIDQFSQRTYNIYKRIGWGHIKTKDKQDIEYPIYVLVGPKGNTFSQNNTITEYGRNDSVYSEVENSIGKDNLLIAMYHVTGKKFTTVEEMLNDLVLSLPKVDTIKGWGMTIDEDLVQTLREYKRWIDITENPNYHEVLRERYTRSSVENDPENMYIFTDNTDRTSGNNPINPNSIYARKYGNKTTPLYYPDTTSATVRGLDNAYPISTQRYYHDGATGSRGNWNDSDIEEFKEVIEDELSFIQDMWMSGLYKNIILPSNGLLGGKIANITEERTPKLYEYVQSVEARIEAMVYDGTPIVKETQRTYEPKESTSNNAVQAEVTQQVVDQIREILSPLGSDVFGLADMQKYLQEHSDILAQFFIGKKARTLFEQSLRKARPDMSDAEIQSTLDFLHSLEDNKENTAYIKTAIRWVANRSITLPQDNTKARQAFDLARKKRIDLQKYNTLGELIASPEMQPKKKEKKSFDPDAAKTFSNKRTVTTEGGRVFTVYDVENTEEGQREVCKALAAHYEMSPWCLSTFTAKGEPTESAKNYWNLYKALPRKIAYENGKPVAFNSDKYGSGIAATTFRGTPIVVSGEEAVIDADERGKLARGTIDAWKQEGFVEESKIIPGGLRLTEKAKKELYDTTGEAWWDMEDSHPQESLNDSIVSERRTPSDFDVPFQEPVEPEPYEPSPRERFVDEFTLHLRDGVWDIVYSVATSRGMDTNHGYIAEVVDMYTRELDFTTNQITTEMVNGNTEEAFALYNRYINDQLREKIEETFERYLNEARERFEDQQRRILEDPDDDFFLPFYTTRDGRIIYGFLSPEGDIYLDETIINPEHPIHEYTHLWDRIVSKKNPKLWKRGIELMKKLPLWDEIENDPNYGVRWKSELGMTEEKLERRIASEVHARIVGKNGKELLDELAKEKGYTNIVDKLKQWLLDFWKDLKKTFSNWSEEDLNKLTLDEFNAMTLRDFAEGINFAEAPTISEGSIDSNDISFAIKYGTPEYYETIKLLNEANAELERIIKSNRITGIESKIDIAKRIKDRLNKNRKKGEYFSVYINYRTRDVRITYHLPKKPKDQNNDSQNYNRNWFRHSLEDKALREQQEKEDRDDDDFDAYVKSMFDSWKKTITKNLDELGKDLQQNGCGL